MKNLKYLLIVFLLAIPVGLVIGLNLIGFDIHLSLESVVGATLVLLSFRFALADAPEQKG
jgi:hypothetical protein